MTTCPDSTVPHVSFFVAPAFFWGVLWIFCLPDKEETQQQQLFRKQHLHTLL